jgi:hypothetical protein
MKYLLQIFENKFKIDYFHYIDDKSYLFEKVILSEELVRYNCNCNFGCGVFELTRQ